jgi:uncharacterized phage protein gp47/JayE
MATAKEYRDSMFANISHDYDKSEGSFIYASIAPVAIELVNVDASIENLKDKLSINNLSGDELEQRVTERTGIIRKKAVKAHGMITVVGDGTVTIGDLFETKNGIQFQSTETKVIVVSGNVAIESVLVGTKGNVPANQITLMPVTIAGITSVNNSQPIIDGFEAESDSDLLTRYFERVKTPPTSANVAMYKNWAKEVVGVGDAKVIPTWNGAGTVKVIIVDANKLPASANLVSETTTYIASVKPLGAGAETIVSAVSKPINISATLILASGFTLGQVQSNFEQLLIKELNNIAFVDSYISYAKMGTLLYSTTGLIDYSNMTLNGFTVNVPIADEEIATIGIVSLGV